MSLVNLKPAKILRLFVALLITLTIFGIAISVSIFRSATAQSSQGRDQFERLKIEDADAYREVMNSRSLSSLLSNMEVDYNESNLLPNLVQGSKTIQVQFKPLNGSLTESKFTAQKPAENLLKQKSLRTSGAPLSRQRAFELAPSEILIVSVDKNKQVLWWDLQPDPRFFKAETADDNGVLSGQTLYLTNADMLVNIPATDEISDLYFYSPNWDGSAYSLELIGKMELTNKR